MIERNSYNNDYDVDSNNGGSDDVNVKVRENNNRDNG